MKNQALREIIPKHERPTEAKTKQKMIKHAAWLKMESSCTWFITNKYGAGKEYTCASKNKVLVCDKWKDDSAPALELKGLFENTKTGQAGVMRKTN
jgi:hypothetical protein